MKKIESYKCLGCKRIIRPVPGKRKKKYCLWSCYARVSAPVWGITKKQAVRLAERVEEVNDFSRKASAYKPVGQTTT